MDWQPIETAPKDGTWFSAWDGHTVFPARWAEDEYDYDGPYAGWCYGDETWGGTLYSGVHRVKRPLINWIPLPTPPAKEQQHD